MRKYVFITVMLLFVLIAFITNFPVISTPINYETALAVKSFSSSQLTSANRLWCLLHERESLMKQVAANKYPKRKPIYDGVRELEVLSHVAAIAKKKQLPLRDMQLYSQIVMDVSRQIQQYWFNSWGKQKTIAAKMSLNQIRESIDKIDAAILDSFILIRKDGSITFKQVQDGLRQSLADLSGIHPRDDSELFIDLLAKAIYPVVSAKR